jgi:FkbM family methyltransferase
LFAPETKFVTPSRFVRFRSKLVRRILFDERLRFFRVGYLFFCALGALPLGGALTYLFAKLRSSRHPARPIRIAVGRGLHISLRDGRTDLAIFEQVMLLGDLKGEKYSTAPEYILDAGAHIGCSSIYYALKYPGARIVAIEAEGANFRQLCLNVGKIPAIRPVHAAVFHQSGQVVVTNPGDQPWEFRVGAPTSATPAGNSLIRAMTIGELIQFSGFPRLDILKLDIEGAEREVFENDAPSWLRLVRRMTVELHDRVKPGCTQSFEKAVSDIPHRLIKTLNNTVWINLSPP